MCMIAVIPSAVSEDIALKVIGAVSDAWDQNPDGAGFAFALANKVIIRKPFYQKDDLMKALRRALRVRKSSVTDFVIHLRQATHGSLAVENVHPHPIGIGGTVALAHNGVLSGLGDSKGKGKSDTRQFCDAFFGSDEPADVMSEQNMKLLKDRAGFYNKFVLLGPDGKAKIINDSAGSYCETVWYSSYQYRHEKYDYRGSGSCYSRSGEYGRPSKNYSRGGDYDDYFRDRETEYMHDPGEYLPDIYHMKGGAWHRTITYDGKDKVEIKWNWKPLIRVVTAPAKAEAPAPTTKEIPPTGSAAEIMVASEPSRPAVDDPEALQIDYSGVPEAECALPPPPLPETASKIIPIIGRPLRQLGLPEGER